MKSTPLSHIILATPPSRTRSKMDLYSTPVAVTTALVEFLSLPQDTAVWECASGKGQMSRVLERYYTRVVSSDLYDHGYKESGIDFLLQAHTYDCNWIITNPPFSSSAEFIEHAMTLELDGFAFLMKSQYWHAKTRHALFLKRRPRFILPLLWRPDFSNSGKSPTMDCLWTVWDKQDNPVTQYIPLPRPACGSLT